MFHKIRASDFKSRQNDIRVGQDLKVDRYSWILSLLTLVLLSKPPLVTIVNKEFKALSEEITIDIF